MITIWLKQDELNFTLVEVFVGDLDSLPARLAELRADGNEYRAELKTDTESSILGV